MKGNCKRHTARMDKTKLYRVGFICGISFLFLNYILYHNEFSLYFRKTSNDLNASSDTRKYLPDKTRLSSVLKAQEENGMASLEKAENELNIAVPVPKVVIGILSNYNYTCLRDAQRALFVKAAKAYRRLDIKVFFLLDLRSPELDEEQEVHNDIVYLNTTEHGWNNNFAKKLYNWYKFAVEHFPDALLIGRMDDDVFVCTPQIFDRLNEFKNPLLYYGYNVVQGCLDDMFLFVGIELARRIAKRNMCDIERSEHCLQNGNAVVELKKWISIYSDVVRVDERKSHKMVHFYARKSWGQAQMKEMYTWHKHDFCKHYLLFHKATPVYMYELNKNNELLQNDTSRWKVSEHEIETIYNCNVNNYRR